MIQAAILGIVQGLTEFIPVSSSGHLILTPALFGWKDLGLSFDVALHMGTLVALIVYFRREWVSMIGGFVSHVVRKTPYDEDSQGRLFIPILVACVPAAVVGFALRNIIETNLRHWYWVAGALVVVALVMYAADRWSKRCRTTQAMNYADYISIGCAQALALFPGVSRSGITISAGLVRGLDRESAARFSFLLSAPVIFGAGLGDLLEIGAGVPVAQMLVGFVCAAVSGYAAIGFLMNYLRSRSLNVFVVYRICLAAAVAAVFLSR